MTVRWFDGMEVDRNTSAMARAYSRVSSGAFKPQWLVFNSRAGGYYQRYGGGLFDWTIEDGGAGPVSLNPNTRDTFILGFGMRANVADMKNVKREVWNVRDQTSLPSDVEQLAIYLVVNAAGSAYKWRVEANGALVGETSVIYKNDEWYYVEFEVKVHQTTGTLKIHVDGSTVVNVTSKDTSTKGSDVWGHFIWKGYALFGLSYLDLDDLYIISVEVAGSHNTPLGDIIIEAVHPDADSIVSPTPYNDWKFVGQNITARWQTVRDGSFGIIDDDKTYVWIPDNDKKQTFSLGAFKYLVPANIKLISFDFDVRTMSAGSKNIAPLFYSTVTSLVTHSNVPVTSTSYKRKRFFKESPSNATWTLDFASTVEYGFESKI